MVQTTIEEIKRCDDALRIVREVLSRAGKKSLGDALYGRLILDDISIEQFFEVAHNAVNGKALKSVIENARANLKLFR